jgi:nitrite reductase/ring-hydroxylating ferredoxin subunit
MVMSNATAAPAAPSWFELPLQSTPDAGAMAAVEVAGAGLLVANVGGTLLAYQNRCADCGGSLHDGSLADGALSCGSCGRTFFLPGAGRSMDDERLQLQPVPLLSERGAVKVALAR